MQVYEHEHTAAAKPLAKSDNEGSARVHATPLRAVLRLEIAVRESLVVHVLEGEQELVPAIK